MTVTKMNLNSDFGSLEIMMVPGSYQLSEFIGLKVDPLDATVLSKYDLFSEIQNDLLYDKGL